MKRLRRLATIRAGEWAFLSSCLVDLARTDLQLTLSTYSNWQTRLLKATTEPVSAQAAEDRDRLQRLVWLFSVAVRLYPRHASCLHRSLCLHDLLSARGLHTQLRIGIRRPEDLGATDAIEAHAWLEHGGQVLYDQVDPRRSFEQMPL